MGLSVGPTWQGHRLMAPAVGRFPSTAINWREITSIKLWTWWASRAACSCACELQLPHVDSRGRLRADQARAVGT